MTFLLRIKNANLIKIQYWAIFLSIKAKQYFKQYLLLISIILIILIRSRIIKVIKTFATSGFSDGSKGGMLQNGQSTGKVVVPLV